MDQNAKYIKKLLCSLHGGDKTYLTWFVFCWSNLDCRIQVSSKNLIHLFTTSASSRHEVIERVSSSSYTASQPKHHKWFFFYGLIYILWLCLSTFDLRCIRISLLALSNCSLSSLALRRRARAEVIEALTFKKHVSSIKWLTNLNLNLGLVWDKFSWKFTAFSLASRSSFSFSSFFSSASTSWKSHVCIIRNMKTEIQSTEPIFHLQFERDEGLQTFSNWPTSLVFESR